MNNEQQHHDATRERRIKTKEKKMKKFFNDDGKVKINEKKATFIIKYVLIL